MITNDFLSNVESAFLKLFQINPALSALNWQTWDSDADVTLPRATISLSAKQAFPQARLYEIQVEINLDAAPKDQKLSQGFFALQRLVEYIDLPSQLNSYSTGLVNFNAPIENAEIRQTIEGDIRRRSISFSIFAASIIEWPTDFGGNLYLTTSSGAVTLPWSSAFSNFGGGLLQNPPGYWLTDTINDLNTLVTPWEIVFNYDTGESDKFFFVYDVAPRLIMQSSGHFDGTGHQTGPALKSISRWTSDGSAFYMA